MRSMCRANSQSRLQKQAPPSLPWQLGRLASRPRKWKQAAYYATPDKVQMAGMTQDLYRSYKQDPATQGMVDTGIDAVRRARRGQ